jgi:hypothetical protein
MKLEDPKKLNPKYIEWLEKELIKLKTNIPTEK